MDGGLADTRAIARGRASKPTTTAATELGISAGTLQGRRKSTKAVRGEGPISAFGNSQSTSNAKSMALAIHSNKRSPCTPRETGQVC